MSRRKLTQEEGLEKLKSFFDTVEKTSGIKVEIEPYSPEQEIKKDIEKGVKFLLQALNKAEKENIKINTDFQIIKGKKTLNITLKSK